MHEQQIVVKYVFEVQKFSYSIINQFLRTIAKILQQTANMIQLYKLMSAIIKKQRKYTQQQCVCTR